MNVTTMDLDTLVHVLWLLVINESPSLYTEIILCIF